MNVPDRHAPLRSPSQQQASANLSYWYDLADLHGLQHFWKPFADGHRLRPAFDADTIYLELTTTSTASLLYDALLVLYEVFERWSLRALLSYRPAPALWIAKAPPSATRPEEAIPWSALRDPGDFVVFWRSLAASQSLDVDDMGPATTRWLRLRPDTSALNLFCVLQTLQFLNEQGQLDYELMVSTRSIEVIERVAKD